MRIISEIKDYYDSTQLYGQSDNCWVRDLDLVNLEDFKFPVDIRETYYWASYEQKNRPFPREMILIGFCGKIYPVLHLKDERSGQEKYCYSEEECFNFLETYGNEGDILRYLQKDAYSKRYSRKFGSKYFYHYFHKPSIKMYFEYNYSEFEKFFIEHKCPIFIIKNINEYETNYFGRKDVSREFMIFHGRKNKIGKYKKLDKSLDYSLKSFEFYKKFDPYIVFQEIEMYLSGVLGFNNPEIPEVSDIDMVEAKGFDKKTSFRKPKSS